MKILLGKVVDPVYQLEKEEKKNTHTYSNAAKLEAIFWSLSAKTQKNKTRWLGLPRMKNMLSSGAALL